MKREKLSRRICLPAALILIGLSVGSGAVARPRPKPAIRTYNNGNDLAIGRRDLFSKAQLDTYVIASFEFDSLWSPNPGGWTSVDRTAPKGPFFHVDDYMVIGGLRSLWCGARPDSSSFLCGYGTLPGYGNDWDDYFESVVFKTSGDVTLSYEISYDSEPFYDFTFVDYSTDGGMNWTNLRAYDGANYDSLSLIIPSPDSLKIRFHFKSDGGWSDQDGMYDSQGAAIVDNISITDGSGTVNAEDFESESIGAGATIDGKWAASNPEGLGDFAGLFIGTTVLQRDLCTRDLTYLWGFFKNSSENYSCGGHPEQPVVPHGNGNGQYMWNEVWSPVLEWNPGGSIPETARSLVLEFSVYMEQPLDNLVFSTFDIIPYDNICDFTNDLPSWGFFFDGPTWLRVQTEVGSALPPGTNHFRVSLGCIDLCQFFCGSFGSGVCHSHTPLYDHVKLYRVNQSGPVWDVPASHLFQDNFPADGTTTGVVRCDMAMDVNTGSSGIVPGDSMVVNVWGPSGKLDADPVYGGPAVYLLVRSSGGESGPAISGDITRWPVVSVNGDWTKIRMDTVYVDASRTQAVLNEYCVDLNDSFFSPPERIDFYFSATDANGSTRYWSELTGPSNDEAEVSSAPMEMQCLPTGSADVLYVDDYDGWGAQSYFETAFSALGLNVDRYDVRAPRSTVGNGLGSRALLSQIVDVYRSIIWNSGDLSQGTIGDGSGSPEKSPDAQILFAFLTQTSLWDPGLYISGDNVAWEMKDLSSQAFLDLFNYIDYSVVSDDHADYGESLSPMVVGVMPSTIFQELGTPDTLVSYGGCPYIKSFDVLQAIGSSDPAMRYSGTGGDAVLMQETTNGMGKKGRVVLSGFSFDHIRNDGVGMQDRFYHLLHIMNWFGNLLSVTGAGEEEPRHKWSLSQNYPNPFNPVTTIRYSVRKRSRVTLELFNVKGELVATLEDKVRDAGSYAATWDGRNDRGEQVSSGVYFCRLQAAEFERTRKMVLLR